MTLTRCPGTSTGITSGSAARRRSGSRGSPIPTGEVIDNEQEPREQTYTPGPILEPHRWYELEIKVTGDSYAVGLGEVQEGQQTSYQKVTKFKKPAGRYVDRGLPASAGASSGYIGVQAHNGNVAFRQIRVRKG